MHLFSFEIRCIFYFSTVLFVTASFFVVIKLEAKNLNCKMERIEVKYEQRLLGVAYVEKRGSLSVYL